MEDITQDDIVQLRGAWVACLEDIDDIKERFARLSQVDDLIGRMEQISPDFLKCLDKIEMGLINDEVTRTQE